MKWFQRVLWSAVSLLVGLGLGMVCLGLWQWRPWLAGSARWSVVADGIAFEMFFVALFSALGWLVWLVPVATRLVLDDVRWSTRRLVARGGALGGVLTAVFCVLVLHGEPNAVLGSLPNVVTGLLEGVVSTWLCVLVIRRAGRQVRRG